MRLMWAGLIVVICCFAGMALAQAAGEVESIGLDGYYRPDCWTPMVVRVRPTDTSAVELELRVIQEDLDGDRAIATRLVTVTPDLTGKGAEQRFWMYFRPQPTGEGLADAAVPPGLKKLSDQLKVVLAEKNGGKVIANLPLTQTPKRVDVYPSGGVKDYRPVKFVLCVTDGMSLPAYMDYQRMEGIAEQPMFAMVHAQDLPEDARGYEMVDAILWLGEKAPEMRRSAEEPRYRALEQWVRQGGMLVVCQPPESGKLKGFESLLPVDVKDFVESADLDPLPQMAALRSDEVEAEKVARRYAIGKLKTGAISVRDKLVDGQTIPFVARWPLGSGCVTWVAADLGERGLARALRNGWVRIWDEVFGWRNSATPPPADIKDQAIRPFAPAEGSVDISRSFEHGGTLSLRASGYVLIAVLFFGIYWVAGGPGLYAVLSLKKVSTLNWYLFGAIAVAAAFLALLVVRIVQSGSPTLEHVTLVRAPEGGYATIQSRIGLYVPSDGAKELEISGMAPHTSNWIMPYPEHPIRAQSAGGFLAVKQYDVPIQSDEDGQNDIRISMPWRSTLKRIQVRWNGDFDDRVSGKVALTGRMFPDLTGTLVNASPWDLSNVYLVYRVPMIGDGSNTGGDKAIYLPKWNKGQALDLSLLLTSEKLRLIGKDYAAGESVPGRGDIIYGGLEQVHRGWGNEIALREGWVGYWYQTRALGHSEFGVSDADDSADGYPASFPLCSLFQRIPPMRNSRKSDGSFENSRRDVARIGSRYLDVSPALAAGNLIVLAQAKAPLPAPLQVEGRVPKGDGVILYQGILPLGRPAPARK